MNNEPLETLFAHKERVIRSRAPMRISFAGGGTEISPFKERYGGKVMNTTISLFSHATIIGRYDSKIHLISVDQESEYLIEREQVAVESLESVPESNRLVFAILKYCMQEFDIKESRGFTFFTYSEVPVGSGLGASSTLTVSALHALLHYLGITLDTYSLAQTAFRIERDILNLSGGIQDHFCAAFGGFNFMEFGPSDRVLVNPLRLSSAAKLDLESSILLINTGKSRNSSRLIDKQIELMQKQDDSYLRIQQQICDNAENMKIAILKGDLHQAAKCLNEGWNLKKLSSDGITNPEIDRLFDLITSNGVLGSKLCGAGGGGVHFKSFTSRKHNKTCRVIRTTKGRFQIRTFC